MAAASETLSEGSEEPKNLTEAENSAEPENRTDLEGSEGTENTVVVPADLVESVLSEEPDALGQPEKPQEPKKADKAKRTARAKKADKPKKAAKPKKAPVKSKKTSEKRKKSASDDSEKQAGKADKPDKQEKLKRSEKSKKSDKSERSVKSKKPEKPAKPKKVREKTPEPEPVISPADFRYRTKPSFYPLQAKQVALNVLGALITETKKGSTTSIYERAAVLTGVSIRALFKWVAEHERNGHVLTPQTKLRGGKGKKRKRRNAEGILVSPEEYERQAAAAAEAAGLDPSAVPPKKQRKQSPKKKRDNPGNNGAPRPAKRAPGPRKAPKDTAAAVAARNVPAAIMRPPADVQRITNNAMGAYGFATPCFDAREYAARIAPMIRPQMDPARTGGPGTDSCSYASPRPADDFGARHSPVVPDAGRPSCGYASPPADFARHSPVMRQPDVRPPPADSNGIMAGRVDYAARNSPVMRPPDMRVVAGDANSCSFAMPRADVRDYTARNALVTRPSQARPADSFLRIVDVRHYEETQELVNAAVHCTQQQQHQQHQQHHQQHQQPPHQQQQQQAFSHDITVRPTAT